MENNKNTYEKELINGQYYSNKEGSYFPSKEYIQYLQEQRESFNRIKEKKEYSQIIETEILNNYRLTINNVRRKTADLYQKIYYLADNELGNIFQQIKQIMIETNEKVSTMIQDLRNFLGYDFTPSKFENNKVVPIEPNKIRQAWDMLRDPSNNFIAIENTLMFS